MNSDLTFITNEQGQNLQKRFKDLIKDTRFFDVLFGYFYASGFHAIYKSLDKTEKVRILIGISTNRQTYDLMKKAEQRPLLEFSSAETKEQIGSIIEEEMEDAEDSASTEEGVSTFIQWLRSGKLEIKAYPSEKIHAKVYIMTFSEGDRDKGRFITGSSNFSQAGLMDNLEFNVELKNRADYDFALAKFNELWKDAVDVSQKYIETIQTKTWLSDSITPRELYLKFLYEYFKDDLSQYNELLLRYIDGFGNIKTNISLGNDFGKKDVLKVNINNTLYLIRVSNTFSEVASGELLCYRGSNDTLEIATNLASAENILKVNVGDHITIER